LYNQAHGGSELGRRYFPRGMETSDKKRRERLLVSVVLDEKQNEWKNSKTRPDAGCD
jgi:hypothetical protein